MALVVSIPRRSYSDEVFSSEFDVPLGQNGTFILTLDPDQFGPSDSLFFLIEVFVAGVWRPAVGPDTVVGLAGGSYPEPLVWEWGFSSDTPATRARAFARVTGQFRTPVTVEVR